MKKKKNSVIESTNQNQKNWIQTISQQKRISNSKQQCVSQQRQLNLQNKLSLEDTLKQQKKIYEVPQQLEPLFNLTTQIQFRVAEISQLFKIKDESQRNKECQQMAQKLRNLHQRSSKTIKEIQDQRKLKIDEYPYTSYCSDVKCSSSIFQFQWDKDSYDRNSLQIIQGSKIIRIVKNQKIVAEMSQQQKKDYQSGTRGLIHSLQPYPKKGKHSVLFKILQNPRRWAIALGIMTSRWKHKQFEQFEQQVISYYSHVSTGGLFFNELQKVVDFGYNDLGACLGGFIEIVVDCDKGEIQFIRKAIDLLAIQEKVTISKLGSSFKDKDIYVFIRLRNPGDKVAIIGNPLQNNETLQEPEEDDWRNQLLNILRQLQPLENLQKQFVQSQQNLIRIFTQYSCSQLNEIQSLEKQIKQLSIKNSSLVQEDQKLKQELLNQQKQKQIMKHKLNEKQKQIKKLKQQMEQENHQIEFSSKDKSYISGSTPQLKPQFLLKKQPNILKIFEKHQKKILNILHQKYNEDTPLVSRILQELGQIRGQIEALKKEPRLQQLFKENQQYSIQSVLAAPFDQSQLNAPEYNMVQQFMQSQSFQSDKKSGKMFNLVWDSASYNHNRLKVEGSRVERIQQILNKDSGNQLSSACISGSNCLPKQGKHKLIFHIIKNAGQFVITFGIITSQWKNRQFQAKRQQAILYHSHSKTMGSFDIEEKEIIPFGYNNLGTVSGGKIEMLLDFDDWTIQFTRLAIPQMDLKDNIIKAEIPDSFKGKDIYVLGRLYNVGDILAIAEQ